MDVHTGAREPASGRSPDAGFTLVEVIVAILLIGGALLSIAGVSASAFGIQNMARQRQTAVSIANQVMEQIRALPWTDVTSGIRDDDTRLQLDPHLVRCKQNVYRLISCSETAVTSTGVVGTGEPIVKRKTGGQPPLVDNSDTVTVKGIAYTWHAYVTQRIQTSKTEAVTSPYRLTVFVDWTWKGRPMSTLVQSLAWSPEGCLGRSVHPVTGPCVNGRSLVGTASGPTIKVCLTSCATAGTPTLSYTLGRIDLRYTKELVSEMTATATLPDGQNATILVDDDPTSPTPAQISTPLQVSVPDTWNPKSVTFTSPSGGTYTFSLYLDGPITASAVAGFQDGATAANCSAILTSGTPGTPCMGVKIAGPRVTVRAETSAGTGWNLIDIPTGWSVSSSLITAGGVSPVSTASLARSARADVGPIGTVWGLRLGAYSSGSGGNVTYSLVSLADAVSLTSQQGATANATTCSGVVTGASSSCPRVLQLEPPSSSPCKKDIATYVVPANNACTYLTTTLRVYYLAWPLASPPTRGSSSLTVGKGSVYGPTYTVQFRVSTCNALTSQGACSTEGVAQLPTVEIQISFPTMTVEGASTDW